MDQLKTKFCFDASINRVQICEDECIYTMSAFKVIEVMI